ncbi:hypothetical protein [Helicobacter gastrofelis]|nr:hypothetical protein [Helicobacter sp. NHP19-012]
MLSKMEWMKFRELMGISEKIKLVRVIEYEIPKPVQEGYEFLIKHYKDGQVFQEKSTIFLNK